MSEQTIDRGEPAPVAPQRRVTAALADRNFRLIFIGQTLSVLGDGAYVTVLGWFAYQLTHAAGPVAIVLGVVTVAKLVALLFGGALADRYDRRRLMIASDAVRGVALALLATLTWANLTTIAVLAATAALVGLFDSLFNPSFVGIVPSLVDGERLASANGLIGFVRSSGGVAGPALGAGLYAFGGPATVFALDAATFAIAALLVARARPPHQKRQSTTWANPLRDIVDGARYVRGKPILALSIPVAAVAMMLADPPTQTLLPRLVTEFHGGTLTLGALETALGIGFAAGALLSARLHLTRRRSLIVFSAWTAAHFICALAALAPATAIAVVLFFVRGTLTGLGIALWETLLMTIIPADRLSRVYSLDTFGSNGMFPIGFALAAAVAPLASASHLIAVGQTLAGLLMLALLAVRPIRSVQ
jgi:MFS family permease